jgi:hypothetical protein
LIKTVLSGDFQGLD